MQKPNILLITSDQQHYNTIGARNPNIKTPALNRCDTPEYLELNKVNL